jgi:hypothetical protein
VQHWASNDDGANIVELLFESEDCLPVEWQLGLPSRKDFDLSQISFTPTAFIRGQLQASSLDWSKTCYLQWEWPSALRAFRGDSDDMISQPFKNKPRQHFVRFLALKSRETDQNA